MEGFMISGWVCCFIFIFSSVTLMCGCGLADEGQDMKTDPAFIDLSEQFERYPGDVEADNSTAGSFQRDVTVTRKGKRLEALVMIAPIRLRAPLDGTMENIRLEGLATPVFNIGDGFQLDFLLATDEKSRVIESRFFDAGRRREDREWIPFSIPLNRGDREEWLEVRVSSGPQGDLVADWLAMAELRLSKIGVEK
jgi:hypothetical protein